MMPLSLGAALLLAVVMAEAAPPAGLVPTTAAPTDAPNLVSPLAEAEGGPASSSPSPSPGVSLASPLVPSEERSTLSTPLSTRLIVVGSAWPNYSPAATTTTTARSLRRYRTAPVLAHDDDRTGRPSADSTTSVVLRTVVRTVPSTTTAGSLEAARPTSLVGVLRTAATPAPNDDRGPRAAWPTANGASEDTSSEYYKRYYAGASAPATSNASWWSAVQTGLPALGLGSALRRVGHHHGHSHKPFVAAHWEDPDYGDSASGGSQVVALAHHHPPVQHQPVYYVENQKTKDESWGDLTTKLIVLAVIKLLIVKALGLGAFKLLIIGLIKIPIAFAAFALKFAVVVKFFKFVKTAEAVFLAVLVIPILVIAVVPLLLPILIPLGLLIIPLLLIPLLLLFPVPVLTPGGAQGGGTVITITPGRRRREEVGAPRRVSTNLMLALRQQGVSTTLLRLLNAMASCRQEEQAMAQLESRVADSRRCLQKMACDVGYRSQAVKSYADWIMWLLGLIKPILGDTKRGQLKGFISAYKAGLGGRSCYRKYPCYANNMSSKRAKGGKGKSAASRKAADDGGLAVAASSGDSLDVNNGTSATTVVVTGTDAGSLVNGTFTATMAEAEAVELDSASVEERIVYDPVSVEERIVYDPVSASSSGNDTVSGSSAFR